MATASTRSSGAQSARKSTRSTARKTTSTRSQDAIALLKADHKEVDQMFKQFESAKADSRKQTLVAKIVMALKVHTQIEEEIFYPACRGEIDDDMLDEAKVEHQSAKDLIAQIEGMQVGEELYDAKVTVLGEYIRHHVKEEEGEMFPEVRKTDLDLKALGEQLKARRAELEQQMKAQVQ
ncbi:MAG TPA: hemerythrin domain-containing protein [Caulobacteraceae bacterium]|nr:hemerythrin domain-containing protein [Caulobacteraceae bacterium]